MNKACKIKGKIVENGYSVKSFSEHLGMTRQTLSAKLNGTRNFSIIEIKEICTLLSIPKNEIGDYFF